MNSFNQTLHILRKDVRHLLPEITISLSLVAIFGWIAPASWPGYLTKMAYPGAQFGAPAMIGGLLHVLIPLSWLILISRVVHDESLVGDKQFWVTRPYTWYSLLAAKLLFIASFICLPLLLAQMFLVHYAGLPVLASLPGLVANIGMIALCFLLPFTVLAAVTSSFGPLVLLVLGGILYIGVVGLLETYLSGARVLPPYADIGCFVLLVLILAGTLVYQYIKRKTGLSQLILIATPVVIAVVLLVLPAGALFAHAYPVSNRLSATVDLDPMKQQPSAGPLLHVNGSMVMSLPVEISGEPDTGALHGKALQMELTSASGFHWKSSWQRLSELPFHGPAKVDVWIPQSVIERVGSDTVKVRLALAVDRDALDRPITFALGEEDHAVPGGVCSLVGDSGFSFPVCRYALRMPTSIVETQAFDEPCPLGGSAPASPPKAAIAIMEYKTSLYAFDPILPHDWRLNVSEESPEQRRAYTVCAGAPVKLTVTHAAGREQIQVEQTGIELTPYLRHLSGQKRMGFGPGQPPQ